MKPNNQNEVALAQNVLDAFIKNNHQLWLDLYPTNEESKMVLQAMLDEQPASLTKNEMDKMLEERREEAPIIYMQEYEQMKNGAESLGMDWSKAAFERFKYDASPARELHFLYLNGRIFFSSGERHFMLHGVEAMQIGSAYKLQAVKGFAKLH